MAVQQLAAVVYIPDSPLAAVRRDRCEGCGPALAGSPTARCDTASAPSPALPS